MSQEITLPLIVLAGGPKNTSLLLEQAGLRYATLFTSEAKAEQFKQACCSVDSYELRVLATIAEVRAALQGTRKYGCSLLLVDPPGPEIKRDRAHLSPDAEHLPRTDTR